MNADAAVLALLASADLVFLAYLRRRRARRLRVLALLASADLVFLAYLRRRRARRLRVERMYQLLRTARALL